MNAFVFWGIAAGCFVLQLALCFSCRRLWPKLLPAAVLLLLAGACLVIAHWARLFKGAGYQADVAPGNGLYGQGRQQSEVYRDKNIPQEYEDRPTNK